MKREEWKQLGPKDQSTAILASLSWDIELMMIYPDTVPAEEVLHRMLTKIAGLKELCRDYLPERWTDEPQD